MAAIRGRHRLLWLLLACLLALLAVGPVDAAGPAADAAKPAAQPAEPAAQVYFVAGVDVPVAVSMDGERLGEVAAASVFGPLRASPGQHEVEFEAAEWSVVAEVDLTGPSTDIVVHRPADASDDPRVTVFTNDVKPITPDKARLTVAHTAVVPPADVRVAGKVLFANIANGEFVTAEVPADTYSVDIVPTGESTPLFGPLDLTVKAGALNRVFAIGRPENGSMEAVVQVIPLRRTGTGPPTSVDAGEAGLVAPNPPASCVRSWYDVR